MGCGEDEGANPYPSHQTRCSQYFKSAQLQPPYKCTQEKEVGDKKEEEKKTKEIERNKPSYFVLNLYNRSERCSKLAFHKQPSSSITTELCAAQKKNEILHLVIKNRVNGEGRGLMVVV